MVTRFACLVILVLLSPAGWALSQVTASVDKNPVFVNEPFVLEVVADDSVSTSAFSASVLLRKGFIVGGTQVSTHRSISGGGVVKRTAWRTELRLVRPGKYQIPAFDVDGHFTDPIEIEVVADQSPSGKGETQDLFLTAELSDTSAYPQQQVLYTLKIYIATELRRATLSEPEMADGEVRQLGQDRESNEIIDGRRYRVIERRYAVSPANSGSVTITGPVFKGEIFNESRRGGFYSVPVNTRAESLTLTVKPIPADFPGQWLPGVVANLHEEWQPDITDIRVGEPITRTLTFSIGGTNHNQIPSLVDDYPDSIRVYPDQVDNQTYVKDDLLVAQRLEAKALIPSQPGEIVLPEIRIPWWNTELERLEFAILPARTLNVLPAEGGDTQVVSGGPQQVAVSASPFWRNIAGLLLLLWLATLGLWYWRSHRRHSVPSTTPPSTDGRHWERLQSALKRHDDQQVLCCLTPWLQQTYQVATLSQLSGGIEPELHQALQQAYAELSAARYQKTGNALGGQASWRGDKLLALLQRLRSVKSSAKRGAGKSLPPLYPTGD